MKKITLALLGSIGLIGSMSGQASYILEAPQKNGSTSEFRAPNGTNLHSFQRTVMYINPVEMLPLSQGVINTFSFQYTGRAATACPGTLTVYMANTNDAEYLKGTNWTTAIAGMTQVYNGPYTVPAGVGAATVGVGPFAPTFTYTGGGLYVAYDWVSTGPFSASTATYACNNTKLWCATTDASVAPVGTTLGGSYFRPALLFTVTNQATNDIGVLDVIADGHISKIMNAPQTVLSDVVNSGFTAMNNVSVALTVGGANSYTNVQVIPSLAAGSIATVTFAPFSSPNGGINTLSVTALVADNVLANNQRVWTQSVTCTEVGAVPPAAGNQFLTTNAYGMGSSGSGFIYTTEYTPPSNATLSAVKLAVANFTAYNIGKQVTPVLLDNSGNILYSGNPVTTTSQMLGNWTTLNLPVPQSLNANTTYYIGVSLNATSFYPMAILNHTYTPYFVTPGYYQSPIAGGSLNFIDVDYFGLVGVLSFSNTQITASSNFTSVCKNSPRTVTITATGADSFTYSAAGLGNGGTAVWTPTAAGSATIAQMNITGSYTTGSLAGCKSSSVGLLFTLAPCLGINDVKLDSDVNLMPNPSVAGKSTLTNLGGYNNIVVFNSLGQVVVNMHTNNDSEVIDLSMYPAGNYIIRVTGNSVEPKMLKLVNQN